MYIEEDVLGDGFDFSSSDEYFEFEFEFDLVDDFGDGYCASCNDGFFHISEVIGCGLFRYRI